MGNFYDQVEIDVEQRHHDLTNGLIAYSKQENYLNVIHRILCRANIYQRFVDSGFVRGWFNEFGEFWGNVIHGRPLKLHDFFYLYSAYRTRFQNVEVAETPNAKEFLHAWQRYENIYSIFDYVYLFAMRPFSYLPFKECVVPKDRILEYGCGVAPIVTSMIKSRCNGFKYTVADIKGFPYLYAKYRLLQHGVECVDIEPYEETKLSGYYNVIFLQTVLEHLPNPLEVVKTLAESMVSGGYLIFDYILGGGTGLDTIESIRERKEVLDFIKGKYEIVLGKILYEKSMGTTIVRKK